MKYLFLSIFAFIGYSSFAQISNEQKIEQVYGSSITTLTIAQRNWVENCLSRCEIISAEIATSTAKDIRSIPLNDKYNAITADESYNAATFNPLKYRFDFFNKKDQYFTLFDSGKILKIKGKE